MRSRLLRGEPLIVGLLAVAAAIWSMVWRPANPFRGQPVEPPVAAPAFTLVDQHGRPFSSTTLNGKVVAIFFGYTHCPDVCPATLSMFARARRQLQGVQASDAVQFVFVSVDPERDTSERIRQYLQLADPAITGLTGSPQEVQQVLDAWGVAAEKMPLSPDNPNDYTMTHTAAVLLVDRAGRIRVRLPFGASADDLVHDVQQLLRL